MRMRIKMTYKLIDGISKLKMYKPCFKRYLTTQIEGRALEITPNYWDTMAMLPLAQWQKENARTNSIDSDVWPNSGSWQFQNNDKSKVLRNDD